VRGFVCGFVHWNKYVSSFSFLDFHAFESLPASNCAHFLAPTFQIAFKNADYQASKQGK